MPSRRLAVVVIVVLVFALAVVAIAPAFATTGQVALPLHARLVGSSPADASTVDDATRVVLEFSEVVNPSFVTVRVEGEGGAETDGPPAVEGRTVTQPLTAGVAPGKHTVTYRVVSADGHPISGKLTFTTTADPAGEVSASPSATASAQVSVTPSTSPAVEEPATAPTATGPATPVLVALAVGLLAAVGFGTWRLTSRRAAGT